MKWATIKEKKWFKWSTNKYILITGLFAVWMTFFDDASLRQHIRIDREIEELKKDRNFYNAKLQEVKTELKKIQDDPKSIEKIAREHFYMKKDREDIFVVVEENNSE
ncbi:MAG: FtsB family cell division protein [Flavobacteriales bacterium]